jgi:hypothetical protein
MNRTALALPLILAACAPAGPKPPSLLPRPIEKLRIDDPAVETVGTQAAAASPQTQTAITRLLKQAQDGENEQLKVYTANRNALAGLSAAPGSERYVAAQTALSAVQSARIPTLDAIAELDRLALNTESSADAAALLAAQAQVQKLIDAQDARLR